MVFARGVGVENMMHRLVNALRYDVFTAVFMRTQHVLPTAARTEDGRVHGLSHRYPVTGLALVIAGGSV